MPGQYKTKRLRCTGEQRENWKGDGTMVNLWQADVMHFWYGQQFDSDTFLVYMPTQVDCDGTMVQVSPDDALELNWTVFSLVEEDFAPTSVMRDVQVNMPQLPAGEVDAPGNRGGMVRFPFKGFDSVWVRINPRTKVSMRLAMPALRFIRGIYTWGWNVHPPRIQFIQPIGELIDKNGDRVPDWQAHSFMQLNAALTLDTIGEAAPEKKLYRVAMAALEDGVDAAAIVAMLNDPEVAPKVGVWTGWLNIMEDQRQLPPEARTVLEADGKSVSDYDFVTVYMNDEMYGQSTLCHTVRQWSQGEEMTVRLINLDAHTHYFRNVGFSAPLNNEVANALDDGIFSFEIMNFKPLYVYGAPKVAEMQWSAGWGFRPHYSTVQQKGVFSPSSDQRALKPYYAWKFGFPLNAAGNETKAGKGGIYYGYQFKNAATRPFSFNPPDFIVGTVADRAPEKLWDLGYAPRRFEGDDLIYRQVFLNRARTDVRQFEDKLSQSGQLLVRPGLVIGQTTEGYGQAQFCPEAPAGFCDFDAAPAHPLGFMNYPEPTNPDLEKTELRFPPFLRSPAQGDPEAGDIIPPTPTWEPFLFLNPRNGTIWNDPDDPSKGYWADHTYAHGAPLFAGEVKDIVIEMPRARGQLFYQFDDLFHDNAIFTPHPITDSGLTGNQ